jgi:hypothetical protein
MAEEKKPQHCCDRCGKPRKSFKCFRDTASEEVFAICFLCQKEIERAKEKLLDSFYE